jgi:tape measure domain-containing protein
MSNSVDNPVVKMTFDNGQFERNASQTMSSIEKLKQSLNFTQGKQNMAELSAAAGKVDMTPIGTQVEGVNAKFLALATIAVTALSNIASKAIEVGATLAKSLTIGPLTEGFREYETNMNSIQTILANTQSKGSTLEDVEGALKNLNEYSDKTIYNFGEMAKNIGTFTAAGVDLDSSTNAIKGIANLAAISGSNSQQASMAMYQLSQALAVGKVGLVDWNSVVNAGMGGQVFKEALFETAKAMGTIANVPMDQSFTQWEDAGNSFRDSLQDGWITADVLSNTLQTFTGDLNDEQLRAIGYNDIQIQQFKELGALGVESATKVKTFTQLMSTVKEAIGTGWADSFKIVIGDFEEARGLFTNINDYLGKYISGSAKARNNLLEAWKGVGGREVLLEGLTKGLAALESVLKPIKSAFRELFPAQTAENLINLTMRFRDFMNNLILSKEQARQLRTVFVGVFSVFKIGVEVIKGIFSTFKTLATVLFDIIGSFSGAAQGGAGFLYKLQEMLVAGGGIRNVFNVINTAIVKFGDFVLEAKQKLDGFVRGLSDGAEKSKGFESVVGSLKRLFDKLKQSGGEVKEVFDTIKEAIGGFFDRIRGLFSGAGDGASGALTGFIDSLSESISPETFDKVFTALGASFLGGIAVFLGKLVKDGLTINVFSDLVDNAAEAFDKLGGALQAFTVNQKADLLKKIAISVAVLTASLLILSFIDPAKLGKALGALAVGMGVLIGVLALFTKISVKPFQFASLASSMVLISVAALILAAAIKVLSSMSWSELAIGLAALTGALLVLAGAAAIFSKVNGSFIKAGISLIVLSGALWVFAQVLKSYAQIPFDVVKDGLLRVGLALLVFAGFTKIVDPDGIIRTSIGIIGLSLALKIMVGVIQDFGALNFGDLVQGMVSVGLILAGFAVFLRVLPSGKETLAKAAALLIMAGSLYVIAEAVAKLASLKFTDLLKGLGAMAILLVGLVVAANALNGSIMGAVAIVVMAGALHIMAGVLEKIGKLGLGTVLVGLLGLAGVLVILGLAAAALVAFPPLLAALTAMGSILLMVGAGFALLGAGAYLAAKAIEIFANVGAKAGEALTSILSALGSAIPDIAAATAGGIIAFVSTIAEQTAVLVGALGDILEALIDELITLVPKFGELLSEVFGTTLDLLEAHAPRMIETGLMLINAFLIGVRDNIGNFAMLGMEILSRLIDGIAAGLPLIAGSVRNLVISFVNQLILNVQLLIDAGVSLIVAIIQGITEAIPQIVGAVGTLITTFMTTVASWGLAIIGLGFQILEALLEGIAQGIINVGETVTTIVTTFMGEVEGWWDRIKNKGIETAKKFLNGLVDDTIDFIYFANELMLKLLRSIEKAIRLYSPQYRAAALGIADAIIDGLTGGLSDKAGRVISKIREIAGDAIGSALEVFGINSPSKVFRDIGRGLNEGLVLGVLDGANTGPNAVKGVANATVKAFGEAMSGIKYDLESLDEFNPTITPVLDLTNVNRDAQGLSGLLGSTLMTANLSTAQARYLAVAQGQNNAPDQDISEQGVGTVVFEQNNYSPRALSASDIYRGTRSQIAIAKETLGIP